MCTKSWALNMSCLVLLLGGLAPAMYAADDSPYRISKKEFRQQVNSVSLSPLHVPPIIELSEDMRRLLEAEAVKRLSKTKLEFLPIEPYAQLRATFAVQIGGLYNASGELDARRQAVVFDHAKREMRMRHQVDAFAEISVRMVHASFLKDRAEWDGIKQKVQASGDGFALFGGNNYQGSIAAASFQLAIYDRSDNLLFVNRGGIEVLQERVGTQLKLLDMSTILNDEKRMAKAVRLAFDPI